MLNYKLFIIETLHQVNAVYFHLFNSFYKQLQ